MDFGTRIKACRKARKLTQKQLADMVGAAEITIRQIESGKRNPSWKILGRIANALNVRFDYLIFAEDLENWIMDRDPTLGKFDEIELVLTHNEAKLIFNYQELSPERKEQAFNYVEELYALESNLLPDKNQRKGGDVDDTET